MEMKEAVEMKKSSNKKKNFSLYAIASGKPGRKFTEEEFLALVSKAKTKPGGSRSARRIALSDGYVYCADSAEEAIVLKKLIAHKAFIRLRGQSFAIPYRFGGKDHEYYPDMVMLTNTGRIVFLEVKQVAQMNAKANQKKYAALKRYCERHGYLYLMCDKRFNVYGRLDKRYVMPIVIKAIEAALKEKGRFLYSDYRALIEGKNRRTVNKIRKSIGVYVATRKRVKMVGDLAYHIEELRVLKTK